MADVFNFWINVISKYVSFLFTLKINENPDITIGMFLLGVAFIGVVIYFIISISTSTKGSSSSGGKEE